MTELTDRLAAIKKALPAELPPVDIGVILGSGLGAVFDDLTVEHKIDYAKLGGLAPSTAPGHAGQLLLGDYCGKRIAICAGRVHLYEGHSPLDVAMTAYLLNTLGAKKMVITNAAGGLNADFKPGDIMLIDDHINATGRDPLRGPDNPEVGPRFPDMSRAYCPALRKCVVEVAMKKAIELKNGIYVGVHGPSLETSAERRFFHAMGGDAVGMSTVLEVIAAIQCGADVLGVSAITNIATGDADQPPDTIEDVLQNAASAGEKINALMRKLIPVL